MNHPRRMLAWLTECFKSTPPAPRLARQDMLERYGYRVEPDTGTNRLGTRPETILSARMDSPGLQVSFFCPFLRLAFLDGPLHDPCWLDWALGQIDEWLALNTKTTGSKTFLNPPMDPNWSRSLLQLPWKAATRRDLAEMACDLWLTPRPPCVLVYGSIAIQAIRVATHDGPDTICVRLIRHPDLTRPQVQKLGFLIQRLSGLPDGHPLDAPWLINALKLCFFDTQFDWTTRIGRDVLDLGPRFYNVFAKPNAVLMGFFSKALQEPFYRPSPFLPLLQHRMVPFGHGGWVHEPEIEMSLDLEPSAHGRLHWLHTHPL